jgi:hypothetical protein
VTYVESQKRRSASLSGGHSVGRTNCVLGGGSILKFFSIFKSACPTALRFHDMVLPVAWLIRAELGLDLRALLQKWRLAAPINRLSRKNDSREAKQLRLLSYLIIYDSVIASLFYSPSFILN